MVRHVCQCVDVSSRWQLRRSISTAIDEADALKSEVCDGLSEKMVSLVRLHGKLSGQRFVEHDSGTAGAVMSLR